MARMLVSRQDDTKSGTDTLVDLLSKGFGSQVRKEAGTPDTHVLA